MNALARHRALSRIWSSEPGWRGVISTVNHSDIGRMFLLVATLFFLIGGVLAMLIRTQLATPHSAFVAPAIYDQIFTMHGTVMMFLFAIPLFEGAAVYLLPKLLGTRDLAYPRLSAYGFWCYVFGGLMLVFAMLAGLAPDSGWFMYPPLSSSAHSPGVNADFWLIGVTFVEVSAHRRGRRDLRLDPEVSRAGHVAGPHADLRLVCARHRADDPDGLSAADPRLAFCSNWSAPSAFPFSNPRLAGAPCSGSTSFGSSAIRRSTSSFCPPPASSPQSFR